MTKPNYPILHKYWPSANFPSSLIKQRGYREWERERERERERKQKTEKNDFQIWGATGAKFLANDNLDKTKKITMLVFTKFL